MSTEDRHPEKDTAAAPSTGRRARTLLGAASAVCALTLAASGAASAGGPPAAGPRSVIEDRAYKPGDLTVAAGQSVTWHNEALSAHTVTSTTGLFDSARLNSGETYTTTFANPGTFDYYCTIHPTMKGAVTVLAIPAEMVLLSVTSRRVGRGRAARFEVEVARSGVKAQLQVAPARGAGGWRTAARAALESDGSATLRLGPSSSPRRARVVVPGAYGQPRLLSRTVRLPG